MSTMSMDASHGVPAEFINTLFVRDARINMGFDHYTLRSLLGSGGLGVVIKAQKRTGELVALKFLHNLNPGRTSDTFERFKQEIRATKMVGEISDSCVRVYECGEYPVPGTQWRVPFFCMEYVPGLSLEDFIILKETPFTPTEVYVICRQIATALEDIHDKGIVHRDIKPSNILFHETQRMMKVTDFGISRDLTARTDVTLQATDGKPVILGTINYLSRYYFDTVEVPPADVIALENGLHQRRSTGEGIYLDSDGKYYCAYKGKLLDLSVLSSVILFELMTRLNPYSGSTFPAIITDIMNGARLDLRSFHRDHPDRFHTALRRRPGFLSQIDRIIRKGNASRRGASYQSARGIIADLDMAIKSFCGYVPNQRQADEVMGTLLGKTLVDEYERVLRRIELAIRNDRVADDRKNISRLALLYKLKKSDRLMSCIELLHGKTHKLAATANPPRRECHFLHSLWERLERYGVEPEYRHNSAALHAILSDETHGGGAS